MTKFKLQKSSKTNLQTMTRTPAKFQIDLGKTVKELRPQDYQCLYALVESEPNMTKLTLRKK